MITRPRSWLSSAHRVCSNPFQRDEYQKRDEYQRRHNTDHQNLVLELWQIIHEISNHEEGEIPQYENEPREASIPPPVVPFQGADAIQDDFNHDADPCENNREEVTVVDDPEDLGILVFGKQFGAGKTQYEEHEHYFYVPAYEGFVGSGEGAHPHTGVPVGSREEESVPYLIERVHQKECQTRQNGRPVFHANFINVEMQDDKKQRDDIPFELCSIAEDCESFRGAFALPGILRECRDQPYGDITDGNHDPYEYPLLDSWRKQSFFHVFTSAYSIFRGLALFIREEGLCQ